MAYTQTHTCSVGGRVCVPVCSGTNTTIAGGRGCSGHCIEVDAADEGDNDGSDAGDSDGTGVVVLKLGQC